MRAVIWRRRAEEDLAEAYRYIAADSPAAAERFVDRVASAVEMLSAHPAAGRTLELRSPWTRGMRVWLLHEFSSYLLCYRSSPQVIEVVRLLHGARRWLRILGEDQS